MSLFRPGLPGRTGRTGPRMSSTSGARASIGYSPATAGWGPPAGPGCGGPQPVASWPRSPGTAARSSGLRGSSLAGLWKYQRAKAGRGE